MARRAAHPLQLGAHEAEIVLGINPGFTYIASDGDH
jgi:hypothetical protein